jgi:hypothetical protein
VQLAVFSILVGVLSGFAGGGRFANVGWKRIQFIGLPAVGFSAVAISRWLTNDVAFYLGMFGLCCLAGFAIANVKALSCMWLVALGLVLNVVVTANNHGMPYSPVALATAGVRPASYNDIPKSTPMSHPERPGDQLLFLSDVIPLQPMRTVVSFGDILVALGMGCVTATAMWARRPRRLRNPRHLKQSDLTPSVSTRGSNSAGAPKRRRPRIGYHRPSAAPGGVATTMSLPALAEAGAKLRTASGGVVARLREARASGGGLTPKELAAQLASQLAAQREETTFKNWVEVDGSSDVAVVDVPIVAGGDTGAFGDANTDENSGPSSHLDGDSGNRRPPAPVASPADPGSDPGSDPRMAARLRLLRVTGDASALIDLSNGTANDFDEMAAEHAVGAALRRYALDERLVARASSMVDAPETKPSPVGENDPS